MGNNFKNLRLRRERLIMYFIIISFFVTFESAMGGCREEEIDLLPGAVIFKSLTKECIFPNTAEFRNAPELKKIETAININANEIPESSTDIYYFKESGGQGSTTFFSLTLPLEESIKFTEKLSGVAISEFREWVIDYTSPGFYSRTLKEGPASFGEKWKTPYWDLKNIKRGKCYEKEIRFIAVDLNTNRVYLCI